MKLNPQQRAAVEYCDGPLLVLAGAGSGKTRVIAEKIAYLVRRKNLTPGKVAAITFTNKAAREMRERAARLLKGEAADLYGSYHLRLKAFHAVDFDDFIRLPLALLERDAETRDTWRERIRYLLVDEYQDTNDAQYRWLKLLTGARGALTVVGDDDQSIYAWRGANPGNLDELAVDYPQLEVIKLEQNYRCPSRVLRTANALIQHNPHKYAKNLWSEQGDGAPVRVLVCRDDEHEAERIAADIGHLAQKHGARWNEFAVLYRGNHQSRPLEKALRLARVPYHLTGGTAFLERAEVKDLLAYLRLIVNPDDDAAFLRIANVPPVR